MIHEQMFIEWERFGCSSQSWLIKFEIENAPEISTQSLVVLPYRLPVRAGRSGFIAAGDLVLVRKPP